MKLYKKREKHKQHKKNKVIVSSKNEVIIITLRNTMIHNK